ncbi:hypothetical protein [Gloeocapsa sp. PCC 73106]|nr:hypothetical protein [Gloeocapsa sp. PCC 73106]
MTIAFMSFMRLELEQIARDVKLNSTNLSKAIALILPSFFFS